MIQLLARKKGLPPGMGEESATALRYHAISRTLSLLSALLGLMVLFGWYAEYTPLVTVLPDLPAMSFNTALGFLLLGAGLFWLDTEETPTAAISAICSALVLVIAGIRLMEHMSILPSHIDNLFVKYLSSAHFITETGGGMGANTALSFVLVSLVLLSKGRLRRFSLASTSQELGGLLAIALGMLSLAGYVTGAKAAYDWGSLAAMALHTSLGVIGLGAGLMFHAWSRHTAFHPSMPLWVPASLCFTGLLLDLYTPLGIAAGIFYVPLVLSALWFPNKYAAFYFAFTCSVLTILGYFASSQMEGVSFWHVVANRLLAISALWVVAGLVYYFRLISHNYEGERVRFDALMRATPDTVITMDEKGFVRSFNPSAERAFGYSADEVIGRNINMLMPEPYHSQHDGYLKHYKETGEARIIGTNREVSGKHRDGSVFPIDLSISAIVTGQERTFVGIIRDISDRKRYEDRLMDYMTNLERSNQELDDFAYIASHDLKEPLRGLHNHARFLLEDNEDKLDEDSVRRLKRLSHLTQRMEKLINDLLYFSRLGRQEMAIVQTDFNVVIKDICATLEHFLEERHAKVTIKDPLPLTECDGTRMTEAFRNLIVNAVKYNDKEQREVEIGYLADYQDESGTEMKDVFYVRDNGKGIKKEFHEDIFRIFKRLERSEEGDDGTGAGLTFVKKIIGRHRGKIWLESEPGQGTTFYFTLPGGIHEHQRKAA